MASEPTTPLTGTPTPARPTAPPKVQFTPAQLLADNLSTRLRELAAIAALTAWVLAGKLPALYGAAILTAIVLPIELTRQLVKVGVARLGGGGGAAAVLGVVALHKVLTYGGALAGGAALAASLAGCPGLPPPEGCTPRAQRCSPAGAPQICSPSQRWTPADRTCAALGAVCCRVPSVWGGRPVVACAPAAACLPDRPATTDGGVE